MRLRLNFASLLFLPGLCAVGGWLWGTEGALGAAAVWAVLAAASTVVHLLSARIHHEHDSTPGRPGEPAEAGGAAASRATSRGVQRRELPLGHPPTRG